MWGPGRVLDVRGGKVSVYFRDAAGDDPKDALKVFNSDFPGLSDAGIDSDAILDNLPPYKDGQFERPPRKRVTLEEGLEKFRSLFPLYFEDPRYIGDLKEGERAYKWAAHELFAETLGGERLNDLLSGGDVAEATRRIRAVVGRVNLLSMFEAAAFRDGLEEAGPAEAFLRALNEILTAEGVSRPAFEQLCAALEGLPSKEGKSDPAKWPVATLLQYLADPKRFMFLKPNVTKDCAARLTFDLKYSPQLNWTTYSKLLEMSRFLMDYLAPYGATDFIDVQSFIWVVGGGWDDADRTVS
jgi:hypothetical protein